MSIREDWVRVTPPITVEWAEESGFLHALRLNPRMGQAWTHDALITFGPRGEFRVVALDDVRVPPGTNGTYR
jgi:hypothetical protein